MKYTVQINRSQFDALPVIVLPIDPDEPHADVIPIGTEVHVFTDAELRARDERIIRAALDFYKTRHGLAEPGLMSDAVFARIIAAAGADR